MKHFQVYLVRCDAGQLVLVKVVEGLSCLLVLLIYKLHGLSEVLGKLLSFQLSISQQVF